MSNNSSDWSLAVVLSVMFVAGVVGHYVTGEQSRQCIREGGRWVTEPGCQEDHCDSKPGSVQP